MIFIDSSAFGHFLMIIFIMYFASHNLQPALRQQIHEFENEMKQADLLDEQKQNKDYYAPFATQDDKQLNLKI